jgi:hypothetical protein
VCYIGARSLINGLVAKIPFPATGIKFDLGREVNPFIIVRHIVIVGSGKPELYAFAGRIVLEPEGHEHQKSERNRQHEGNDLIVYPVLGGTGTHKEV